MVHTYSDTAADTLDFSTLSDEIAAITTAGATQAQRDMLANEGVTFTTANVIPGMTYDVDLNNDDDTADANEAGVPGSSVLGIENIIGGGANDTVIVVENQIGSTNNINLAGNANDEGALTVGQDTVQYLHNNAPPGWTAVQTPDVTVGVSLTNTIVTFDTYTKLSKNLKLKSELSKAKLKIIQDYKFKSEDLISQFKLNKYKLNNLSKAFISLRRTIYLLFVSLLCLEIYPLHFLPISTPNNSFYTFDVKYIFGNILTFTNILLIVFFIIVGLIFLNFVIKTFKSNKRIKDIKDSSFDTYTDISNYSEHFKAISI